MSLDEARRASTVAGKGQARPEPLMTADDVAAWFGVTTSWVREAVRDGRLPHVKLGRFTRFERERVEEFIASRRKEARR